MASNFLKQLMQQGKWGDLDYLIVDLPPGTSDIHLTLVQEVGVTGAVIVSTPQQVALADAIKGISMFRTDKINVPVLGLIENMAWFTPSELPDNKYYIFGKEGCVNLAKEMQVPLLGQIPIVQSICESGDTGTPAALSDDIISSSFEALAKELVEKTEERNRNQAPTEKVHIN
jgi:ATP-binding protein involved in chromosome partitioning